MEGMKGVMGRGLGWTSAEEGEMELVGTAAATTELIGSGGALLKSNDSMSRGECGKE